ncbi:MAG: metal-dependent hydrolase [Candidatus Babeliaceae bacterium]|nr:metal-dependent hydrolase [Candidatus Babeliaceae bacterium]
MPEHKTHLFVGFLAYVAVLYLILFFGPICWERKIELLMYTLIGSLFPDIDTKSKIQRIIYCMVFIVLILLAYTQQYVVATAAGIAACLPLMVHHRTLFHSMVFLTLLGAAAVLCTRLYYPVYTISMAYNVIFFLAGIFSHLFADRRLY